MVISSRHSKTAARPGGGAQGWTTYLVPHPPAWQGEPAPRGDHHRVTQCDETNGQDPDTLALGRRGGYAMRKAGKLLTQNQMFGSRQTAGHTPRPKRLLIYISWYINDYG